MLTIFLSKTFGKAKGRYFVINMNGNQYRYANNTYDSVVKLADPA